jgi:hypothetical protein
VATGDTLHGTVTYQNTSASPISVSAIAITSRPPGGTNAGGPYNTLTPSLSAQTIQPGASLTLAASRTFTSADPLGAWYAYTTYQDSAGAWYDGPNVNFTVAQPAAVITVSISPSVVSTTIAGTVSFGATVAGTTPPQSTAVTWSVSAGGGTIGLNTGLYVAPALTGSYTVTATSVADTTKIGTATVAVSDPAPVVTITSSPANPTSQTTASFSFSSSKAGSTFGCKLDSGAAAACASSQSYASLAAGSHTFTATATDSAGKVSAPASYPWSIDLTPPVATISASPANPTTSTTASFSFSSSKTGSTFSCALDAGTAAACTSPQSYSGLAAASHTFTVTAKDPAGNVSAPASYTWTITVAAGGLVISTPLALDKTTVAAGDILNGTVTYQNTSASAITVQAIFITSRPPGGTHAGGPFDALTPSLANQTIQPGASVTLAASRAFTTADPLGAWYAYATWQDSASVWHDGPNVNFTVVQPAQVIAVTVTPSVVSLALNGTITFQATVTGTTTGQSAAVTWSVSSAGGTISAAGVYVAPGVPGSYTITATSVADSTKIGTATAVVDAPGTIIPSARRTIWNPGIAGGIPSRTTICAPINAATYGNGTTDATAAIQSAINGCPAGQVVYLPAGTYATTSTLNIDHGIVLRGAGPALTKIKLAPAAGAPVIFVGLWSSYAAPVAVTADVAKGATSLTVASGSTFAAGDILQLDQRDDPAYVVTGDCSWYKNVDVDGVKRSVGQTVEVASVAGNTLNLTSPIHIGFSALMKPQVTKTVDPFVKSAGIEDLYVTGGTNGMIRVIHSAYSWIKNIESDTVNGQHLSLGNSYRIVVRQSYFHHAVQYAQGGGSYGVSINSQTSDSLIEDNIIYFMNKPFLFESSGGGNVVAYNYIDDAQLGSSMDWQETDIDTHCSFPHMELIEGNYAPHLGADIVHGNSGWLTFYRNYATSQHRTLAAIQKSNVEAFGLEAFVINMNVLGNVLGTAGLPNLIYENSTPNYTLCGDPAIYRLGAGAVTASACTFDSGVAATILRHGNFDYVNNNVVWDLTIANHTLPLSLYLTQKPAFFGTQAWPYVDPAATPMVGVLPAKLRYDSGKPNG